MRNPRHGSLLLDEQLCFALYAAQRAVTAAYRPLLDELGLTYPQYLVMLVALGARRDHRSRNWRRALRLDYGTVSPLLKRLEAAGLRAPGAVAAGRAFGARSRCTGRGEQLPRPRGGASPAPCSRRPGSHGPEVARLREELWQLTARATKAAAAERPSADPPVGPATSGRR